MSADRGGRRWVVAAAPLLCVVAVVLALCWALGRQAAGTSAESQSELDETVSEVMEVLDSDAAEASSTATFLADLEGYADEALAASTVLSASSACSVVVAWEEQGDLVDLAAEVLAAYEELGDAQLATSGYLDLQGNSWGAVVRGGTSWVDIVLISTEDGELSWARIVRLLPTSVDGGT